MIPSMKKAILFFLVLLPFRVFAQGDLLQSLDSVLNRRRYYMDIKENRIRRPASSYRCRKALLGILHLPFRKRAIHPETFEDDVKKLK